jgi:large subunit ribosomal protein L29
MIETMATKRNNIQDLSNMSAEDVLKAIEDSEQRLKRMVFSHAITPIENPMNIRLLRKDIARLKTKQRRLQLGN